MSTPLVSVIIPNYNHARFLEKRIQSVLDQTFQDLEVIILDDASTDNSREIIEGYRSHPKVVHIEYNESNGGTPFKQWNKGVRLARGAYIWIAESDDYADERFLEVMVSHLDFDPQLGLVNCQSWIVDDQDRVTGLYPRYSGNDRWTYSYRNNGQNECENFLISSCTIPNASAVLCRRDAYLNTGQANESFQECGDWWMWVKILMVSDICFIAQPLNYFRSHATNQTKKFKGTTQWFVEQLEVVGYICSKGSVALSIQESVLRDLVDRFISLRLNNKPAPAAMGPSGAQILQEIKRRTPGFIEEIADQHYWRQSYSTALRLYGLSGEYPGTTYSCHLKRLLLQLGQPGIVMRAASQSIKRVGRKMLLAPRVTR